MTLGSEAVNMWARLGGFGRRGCLFVAVVCLGAGLALVSGDPGAFAQGGTVTNFTGTGIANSVAIAAGPDGALWFTNVAGASIGRITTTGTVTNFTGTGIDDPDGIAAGPDGALWFTNGSSARIGRITTTGTVTNYTGTGIDEPSAITAGPDGALWFTNAANNSIGRITTTGTVTNYTGTGIDEPRGIAVGPDGAMWFTNAANNSIGRITTTGTVTNFTGTGIDGPVGITAGPDGALWFTNGSGTSIGRITTTGAVTTYTGTGIDGTFAIAAGPDGALWFTNVENNSVGRITAIGATVSNVAFMGSSSAPQIVVTGSGFGTAPPFPSYPACGDTGFDYGYDLYLQDFTTNWAAGMRTVSGGTDCIGLVVTAWSDSQIVFGLGNDYNNGNGDVLNPGDSYSLTAFATTVTGTVGSFPAATLALSPASGPAARAIVASGTSFSPGENVPVTYHTGLAAPHPTTVVLCTGIVAGDGSFSCNWHIPSTAHAGAAGKHKVTATGVISGFTAKTHFKLT